eukprot:55901-Rhodomonas_salina.1
MTVITEHRCTELVGTELAYPFVPRKRTVVLSSVPTSHIRKSIVVLGPNKSFSAPLASSLLPAGPLLTLADPSSSSSASTQ